MKKLIVRKREGGDKRYLYTLNIMKSSIYTVVNVVFFKKYIYSDQFGYYSVVHYTDTSTGDKLHSEQETMDNIHCY